MYIFNAFGSIVRGTEEMCLLGKFACLLSFYLGLDQPIGINSFSSSQMFNFCDFLSILNLKQSNVEDTERTWIRFFRKNQVKLVKTSKNCKTWKHVRVFISFSVICHLII